MVSPCRSLLASTFLLISTLLVSSFAFIVNNNNVVNSRLKSPSSILFAKSIEAAEDKVLVIGGTGGVGQLVVKKLCNAGFGVRVAARNEDSAKEVLDDESVEIKEIDLLNNDDNDASIESAMNGVSAVVVSVGTTAFPTLKWRGGNTPEAIDKLAVTKIANLAAKAKDMKKIVLVTSVGVDRTDEMPFLILNLFGVLDSKKVGEDAVIDASKSSQQGMEYAIIRPGRLVGGPYTNLDLAKLMQIEGGAENGVTVEKGDALLGDCKRDACAEAVMQCLTNDQCGNVAFSIISNEEKALSNAQWSAEFQKMQ